MTAKKIEDMKAYLRDYRRRLYAHRKANGLCVDTGRKLPKRWKGKPWTSVRHPEAAEKARDRGRKRLGWSKRRIASEPTHKHTKHSLK